MQKILAAYVVACTVLTACSVDERPRAVSTESAQLSAQERELRELRAEVAELSAQVRALARSPTESAAPAAAPGHVPHPGDPRQAPQAAFDLLIKGNKAFAAGRPSVANLSIQRRRELANGQKPYAAILGCADSRSSAEHLFQAGLGDLFVIRSAGNTAFTEAVASTEYGVAHLGVRLVVVMGHTACGAIKAASENNHETPAVGSLVDAIIPSVKEARAEQPPQLVDRSVVINAFRQRDALLKRSGLLRQKVASGEIRVVVAVHDLGSGLVRWLDTEGLTGAELPHDDVYAEPRAVALSGTPANSNQPAPKPAATEAAPDASH